VTTLPAMREPVNGLMHGVAALCAIVPLTLLVTTASSMGKPVHALAFAIFGISMVAAYLASAAYHLVTGPDARIAFLRRVDHLAIFLLIGGTYSPFCLIPLRDGYGLWLFAAVWAIGITGIVVKLFYPHARRSIGVVLYLAMGWVGLPFGVTALETMEFGAWAWLLGGGVVYSIGGVVYALKRPNMWPGVFGFHELWHVFALAGSACHFVVMWRYLLHA
jgi:hemolysin III